MNRAEERSPAVDDQAGRLGPHHDENNLRAELDWLRFRLEKAELKHEIERAHLRSRIAEIEQSTLWRASEPLRDLASRHRSSARVVRSLLKLIWWTVTLRPMRQGKKRPSVVGASPTSDDDRYPDWIKHYDTISASDVTEMRRMARAFAHKTTFSIVMAVADPPDQYLRDAIDSVRGQVIEQWELCIADDASTKPAIREIIEEAAREDPRVKVAWRKERGGISVALNTALELASGDFVAFLDHDDVLRPHALFMVAQRLESAPTAALLYSDEDKIDGRSVRREPHFKPGWNPTLLLGENYLCHLLVCRRDLVVEADGFRSEFDGAQDWDLVLRLTRRLPPDSIQHIPHVLYHWRRHPSSTATGLSAKPEAGEAGRRAVEDHLRASGIRASVVMLEPGLNRIEVEPPSGPPHVDIVVPSGLAHSQVSRCLEGILQRTSYPNYSVIFAVDEDSYVARREELPEHLVEDPGLHLFVYPPRPFSYAWAINTAVSRGSGPLVCMLNDDVDVINETWLEAMVSRVLHPGVGAVGAMLYFPDDTIQHAGVILGASGLADHYHAGLARGDLGYYGRAALDQDLSAVTAACMVVRRDAFASVGGLDEALAVSFNDVDFCLKLGQAGWRIIWTPCAELYHHESTSLRGSHKGSRRDQFESEIRLMEERWGLSLFHDPHYNPNLSLHALNTLAFPPRTDYPWKTGAALAKWNWLNA